MANAENGSRFDVWISSRSDGERAVLGLAAIGVIGATAIGIYNEYSQGRVDTSAPAPPEQNISVPETAAPPVITLEQPYLLSL